MDDLHEKVLPLTAEFGTPRQFNKILKVKNTFGPVFKNDGRVGEIAMVLINNQNQIWLMGKEHYLEGLLRIPTGGINRNEDPLAALKRELKEETSFDLITAQFIGLINYTIVGTPKEDTFVSYIFRIQIGDRTPVPTDESEKINQFKTVGINQLPETAKIWKTLPSPPDKPYYHDWGRFRAILHEVTFDLLSKESQS